MVYFLFFNALNSTITICVFGDDGMLGGDGFGKMTMDASSTI